MELTADQALQKGIDAHKAGKAQEADRYYTAILKSNPKHPYANYNMGLLAVGLGKVQEALPFFRSALEFSPSTEQFWLSYIDALVKLERANDAKTVFDQAKNIGVKGKNFDELEQRINQSIKTQFQGLESEDLPQEKLESLLKMYSQNKLQELFTEAQILTMQYDNSPALWNLLGASAAQIGHLDKAIIAFKKAISIKPDSVDAYNNMGNTYRYQGKLEKALAAYTKAISIKPDYADAHSNMGNALKDQGKLEDAIAAFKKALSINPDYAEAYYNMANTHRDKGNLEEAIAAYTKAISIKPDYAEAHSNMGNAFKDKGNLEEAIAAYTKAISIKPDYAEAYCNIGITQKRQEELEEAITAFKKAISIKPNYTEAHSNMGNTFKEQGKLEEAIVAYKKAIALKPDYAEVYSNMGVAFKELGNLEEAVAAYTKAVSITPGSPVVYNNLGNARKEQGKTKEAIKAYKKAIALKPDYAEASHNLGLTLYGIERYKEAASFFKIDGSSNSQTWLLKCLYELDDEPNFSDQLKYLIKQGENNSIIGSYTCRSKIRYGLNIENPFCNDPLKYVLKTDLSQKCDFQDIFVNGAFKILNEGVVQNKKQSLLSKGSQTAGNVFGQMGKYRKKIQNIILKEVDDYRLRFKESSEGLIRHWPAKYRLDGWIVKMRNGGAIKPHMHEQGWISGSVYINVPPKLEKDSGNLVVCVDSETDEVLHSESIDVVTGSLCLFPSSLLHYTIPFESHENRIVMAFDVVPE